MKNAALIKVECPFGEGDVWIEATATHIALVDFREDFDGRECIRIKTETAVEKQRAIDGLRTVVESLGGSRATK